MEITVAVAETGKLMGNLFQINSIFKEENHQLVREGSECLFFSTAEKQ